MHLLRGLFELRACVEPAAVALAAQRRTHQHLKNLQEALQRMADLTPATEGDRQPDQDFHTIVFQASANPFLIFLTDGILTAIKAITIFKQPERSKSHNPVGVETTTRCVHTVQSATKRR